MLRLNWKRKVSPSILSKRYAFVTTRTRSGDTSVAIARLLGGFVALEYIWLRQTAGVHARINTLRFITRLGLAGGGSNRMILPAYR